MTFVLLCNKENDNTQCIFKSNIFACITLAEARKLRKLKSIGRGSSYRIFWKRCFI